MHVQAPVAGQVTMDDEPSSSMGSDANCGGRESGFALVFVVWCVGLLSLLFVTYVVAAKYRSLEGAGLVAHAEADAFAQAAMRLAIFDLLAGLNADKVKSRRYQTNGVPVRCALGPRVHATISVGDEGGKVDLNTASPELLGAFLEGVYDKATAERFVSRIVAARSVGTPAAGSGASQAMSGDAGSHGPIRTVMELDQLVGAESRDWKSLLPLVTVHSQSPGIDPEVASAAMRGILLRSDRTADRSAPGPAMPSEFAAPSPGRIFAIRAEVATDRRARATWEAVVEFSMDMKSGYRIHEWRTGSPNKDQIHVPTADLPAC